jgi:hypothetical protein
MYESQILSDWLFRDDRKLSREEADALIPKLIKKVRRSYFVQRHGKKLGEIHSPQSLQAFFDAFVDAKIGGKSHYQAMLLDDIGEVPSPSLVPFWEHLLDINKPRDSLANKRRMFTLAALAHIAIRTADKRSLQIVVRALGHKHPTTRADAAHYIERVHTMTGQPLTESTAAALDRIATEDRKFEARFTARRALSSLGRPTSIDHPGGVWSFKVWHERDESTYRVIELRSESSLDELHRAIQRAWQWYNDHLYAFCMTGRRTNERYRFGHTELDETQNAISMNIGEIGLTPRHKFLYLFDFGDNHRFHVAVKSVRDDAGSGTFPRVVEAVGETFDQYG